MELEQLFKRVGELVSLYHGLDKEETKELMKLSRDISLECCNVLYD